MIARQEGLNFGHEIVDFPLGLFPEILAFLLELIPAARFLAAWLAPTLEPRRWSSKIGCRALSGGSGQVGRTAATNMAA